MVPVICENDLKKIVNQIQEYLSAKGSIRGIRLVDCSDKQVVLLIDESTISQETADAWWSGFRAALEIQ